MHGANRLASNSLLEGLVFGARAGQAVVEDTRQWVVNLSRSAVNASPESAIRDPRSAISTAVRKRVKRTMWERVGILRDKDSLRRALQEFRQIATGNLTTSSRNFVTLATLVASAALWREESRGGHYRTDFPDQREDCRVHSIQQLGKEIDSSRTISGQAASTA